MSTGMDKKSEVSSPEPHRWWNLDYFIFQDIERNAWRTGTEQTISGADQEKQKDNQLVK